ncbi:MAG TPA: metal-dependent hydrolase [Symbiobacteriaceae bacterium]|nr:metal-dependent hydrolase [Symbiobacteriaceae bacterium]
MGGPEPFVGRDRVIDNLSHAIIGSAVVALAPPPVSPAVVAAVLIAAEAPDFDFVIRMAGGPVTYLKHHRGPSHGLITLPLQAAAIAGLLAAVSPAPGFWPLFCWALAGGLSHVLFDFLNDYGTQGFWPFSRRWIALDLIPIIDFWMLGTIVAGWVVHWAWPGHRQAIFAAVWLLLLAYVGLRFLLRRRAWRLVADRFDMEGACGEAVPCGPGWKAERLTIHPALLSLRAWRYVAQREGEYLTGMVWVRPGTVSDPERAENHHDRVVLASLKAQTVSTFADWARRPRATVERRESLYLVRWSEMRYEVDGHSPFTAYAWLDDELKLVDEGLGPQRPENIDKDAVKRRLQKEMGRAKP